MPSIWTWSVCVLVCVVSVRGPRAWSMCVCEKNKVLGDNHLHASVSVSNRKRSDSSRTRTRITFKWMACFRQAEQLHVRTQAVSLCFTLCKYKVTSLAWGQIRLRMFVFDRPHLEYHCPALEISQKNNPVNEVLYRMMIITSELVL